MKVLIGYYNANGYRIETADGKVLYTAGANALDSGAPGRSVEPHTLRRWCVQTGKQMAKELGAKWGGAEYDRITDTPKTTRHLWEYGWPMEHCKRCGAEKVGGTRFCGPCIPKRALA